MIILIYSILIYTLLGASVYLIAQRHQFKGKKLTYFTMIFYTISDYVFMPVIRLIEFIENYKIMLEAKKRFNEILEDKSLTQEEKQEIMDRRDEIIDYLTNLSDEVDDDEE